jgi:hypothetical protein
MRKKTKRELEDNNHAKKQRERGKKRGRTHTEMKQ